MLERRSVLAGARKAGGRDGTGGLRRLRIGEARDWKLLQVAAFPTTTSEFEKAVCASIGAILPARVGSAAAAAVLDYCSEPAQSSSRSSREAARMLHRRLSQLWHLASAALRRCLTAERVSG